MTTARRPPQAEHRRLLIWWLTSASILLVILVALAGYWLFTTAGSFVMSHRNGCLPSDFPTYPNVFVQEIDQSFPVPGSLAQCRMRLGTRDVFETVNDFYHVALNSGDWKESGYSEGRADSTINFYRRSHSKTNGVTLISGYPGGTDIQVQLSG